MLCQMLVEALNAGVCMFVANHCHLVDSTVGLLYVVASECAYVNSDNIALNELLFA